MRNYPEIVRSWVAGDASALTTPEERRAIALIASGTATEAQLEAAGLEFVTGIKGALSHEVRGAGSIATKADESRQNVISWKYSDEKPDRMGDIIRADGWELENYKRNSVILWGHAAGMDAIADEPIGRSLDVRVEGKALYGDILFAVDESERAARIYRLAKAGFISAGSVGFRPLKTEHIQDEAERTKLGLGRFGIIFLRQELLEFSLCAIPANPNALQQSLKDGTLTQAEADEIGAQRTEKDWEAYTRRKARSFVSMSRADDAPAISDATLRALAESLTAHAAAHTTLARAITDLGGCIQTLRANGPAPVTGSPAKQAPRGLTAEEEKIIHAIREMK